MQFDTDKNDHGLRFNPFKSLVIPRPIGWISSVSRDGRRNLAPYSFFNAISDRPPMVMFCSVGRKDSLRNIEETGEFTCSLATYDLRNAMNMSSAPVSPGVDEFELAGLTAAPSRLVKAPRVAESPAALECKVWQIITLPAHDTNPELTTIMVLGSVVSIYIDDRFIKDGLVDQGGMKPLSRLGYMDYATVTPEVMFALNRPDVAPDGKTATVDTRPWDGVYR